MAGLPENKAAGVPHGGCAGNVCKMTALGAEILPKWGHNRKHRLAHSQVGSDKMNFLDIRHFTLGLTPIDAWICLQPFRILNEPPWRLALPLRVDTPAEE
jgi:hypothetical protein